MINFRRTWTLMVVYEDGRPSNTMHLYGWVNIALRGWVACAIVAGGIVGWLLQAQFGLSGRAIQLAVNERSERWSSYQRFAPEIEESQLLEVRKRNARMRAQTLGLGDRNAAVAMWSGNVPQEWIDEARRGPKGSGTLMWPVREGVYGRGFGSGEAGYHLAVDIDGPRGSEVLAAASGLVGYAGSELRGYGKVILIVHPGGQVTLYGHNQRLLVSPGEHVHRGQPIAELGSTGHSEGPHVHFELIHDGRNCDPIPLFSQDVPGLPGWLPPQYTKQVAWLADAPKPKGVRCARRSDHPHPKHDPEDKNAPDDEAGGIEPVATLSSESQPVAIGL